MNKKNNKGFSLIELIVVVAIMAVLVGVLAPTYLKYVEKTRVQKDVSAVGEFVQAIKVASADEKINNELATPKTYEITATNSVYTDEDASLLTTELKSVIDDIKLGSSSATKVTVKAQVVSGTVVIEVTATANGTADVTAFNALSTGTVTETCTCTPVEGVHQTGCPLAD